MAPPCKGEISVRTPQSQAPVIAGSVTGIPGVRDPVGAGTEGDPEGTRLGATGETSLIKDVALCAQAFELMIPSASKSANHRGADAEVENQGFFSVPQCLWSARISLADLVN